MMKKAIRIFMLLLTVLCLLSSCASNMTDDEACSILMELIPKAAEFNEAIWGCGLAADESAVLKENTVARQYHKVSDDCKYKTKAEFCNAAAQIFSSDYMKIITEVAFDGTDEIFPRYNETDGVLMVDISNTGFKLETTLYPELASVKKCAFGILEVEIPCDFRGQPDGDYTVTLIQEDGIWKIDSPTY